MSRWLIGVCQGWKKANKWRQFVWSSTLFFFLFSILRPTISFFSLTHISQGVSYNGSQGCLPETGWRSGPGQICQGLRYMWTELGQNMFIQLAPQLSSWDLIVPHSPESWLKFLSHLWIKMSSKRVIQWFSIQAFLDTRNWLWRDSPWLWRLWKWPNAWF